LRHGARGRRFRRGVRVSARLLVLSRRLLTSFCIATPTGCGPGQALEPFGITARPLTDRPCLRSSTGVELKGTAARTLVNLLGIPADMFATRCDLSDIPTPVEQSPELAGRPGPRATAGRPPRPLCRHPELN